MFLSRILKYKKLPSRNSWFSKLAKYNKFLRKLFILWHVNNVIDLLLTRGKPQAPPSSFLAFLIVLRASYIIMQSSFSPKCFRFTDLDINSKWKYNTTVTWIQFLIRRISLLGILHVPTEAVTRVVLYKKVFLKTPVPQPEARNFIKKETLAQVLSCEFWEIFKDTIFYRTLLNDCFCP